jgi:uncharacterized protein (DUF4415 family)
MSKPSTEHNPVRRVRITDEIRRAYEERDKSQDNLDPDAPVRPPEFWEGATIGKWYRPIKTQISLRIDNEVLDWLRSKGEGHLTRINEILRERMLAERGVKP